MRGSRLAYRIIEEQKREEYYSKKYKDKNKEDKENKVGVVQNENRG